MAVRGSMGDLITRTRTLVFDAGNPSIFTDQQMQDALDLYRVERRWVLLRPVQTFMPGGGILFLDYYSDAQNFETDVKLQDASFNDITANADLAEYIVGHWHFPTQPNGMAVRATGKTYDLYGSAADLLESWAAQVKLDVSFTSSGDQFQLSQKFEMLTDLAERYRARALPASIRMVQTDAYADEDSGGIVYPSVGGPAVYGS